MTIANCVFDAQRMCWYGYAYRLFLGKRFCARHTEIASWRVILALTAQLLPSPTRSTGQGCMLTCHILFGQVMEALRAAVATVAQHDEWDLALPHITFGLNTHISTTTKLSPFKFAHGFPARVPLTFGQPSPQAPPGETLHIGATPIANRMKMRHWAATDHMTTAQARLGHVLAKRSRPAILHVGDLVWMDSRHAPNDIPFKLTARWFGPFTVVQVKDAQTPWICPLHLVKHIVRLT